MSKKKEYIEFIKNELKKGNVSFEKVLSELNRTKLNLKRTQFNKYWKLAQIEHEQIQNKANEAKDKLFIDKELEALKKKLNDKNNHAFELLENIKNLERIKAGHAIKVGGKILIANHADEIRAKAEIRQIRKQIGEWYGFNAPIKTEDVQNIKPIITKRIDD